MTIKAKIKEILRKEGSIDNFYCIDHRITTRLGAVIHLLRKEDGWEIEGHKIPDSKNWIYTLVSEPKKHIPEIKFIDGRPVAVYG